LIFIYGPRRFFPLLLFEKDNKKKEKVRWFIEFELIKMSLVYDVFDKKVDRKLINYEKEEKSPIDLC